MGCFLSCFRAAADRSGDLHDPLVVESRLGDAFLDDEKMFSELDASEKLQAGAGDGGGVDDELLRVANYLKSCGTISQTPLEILKASSIVSSEGTTENNDILNKGPLMSGDMQFEGNSSEAFNSENHDILRHQENIAEDTNEKNDASIDTQIMSEAVASKGNSSELFNFDEHDVSTHEEDIVEIESSKHLFVAESKPLSSLQDSTSCQKTTKMTDSSDSPFPTPLVLRGDIQTPGTVYTALNSKAGKRSRASRQFIYPVLRPIENKMQWMEAKVDSPMLSANPPKRRYMNPESSENRQEISPCLVATTETPKSVSSPIHDNCVLQNEVISLEEPKGQKGSQQLLEGGELSEQDSEYGKHGVSSLSYWLKPPSTDRKGQSDTEGNIREESFYEKTTFNLPIFATSGLSWDNDDPTPVLTKVWDGNGIPNTTTKYKEDKAVSWHATPFEERLLKVLSSEDPVVERNISGKLNHPEENEE